MMREHASLGGLVKQDLMPVVNTVLSENALANSVICIDKLVIDLGRIHRREFKGAFKRRLREELDAALKGRIESIKRSPTSRERIIPGPKRHLELIQHFLTTGTLPWTVNFEAGDGLNRCLQSVLAHQAPFFIKFLRVNSHRPQVIQRLVRQFPNSTIRQVARLLTPVQSASALKALDTILRRNLYRSSTGIPAASVTLLAWQHLLEYLLQNRNAHMSSAEFENWLSKRLENRTVSPRQTSPPEAAVSIKETRRIFKGYDLYEAFRCYLRNGIIPWSAGIIAPDISPAKIIEKLSASYPEKLIKIAIDLQFSPGLCRSAAENLTPSLMKRFITALATVSSPEKDTERSTAIQSIIDHADRATDRQGHYAEILNNLVTCRPLDTEQTTTRNRHFPKTPGTNILPVPVQDLDLIRANLTALLKTGKKTDNNRITFSRLLVQLETNFHSEFQDYIAWLAANKKRFTSFVKLSRAQDVNKSLAYLAGFPALKERAITVLEGLPVKFDKSAVKQQLLTDLTEPGQLDDNFVGPGRRTADDETALIRYLTGDPSSGIVSDTAAGIIFKQRLRHGSDTLYASLRSRLDNPNIRKKMTTLLRENWLTRLLAGLRPDLHMPVQLCADTIADACISKAPVDRPETINTLKWEFIFTYLAQAEEHPFHRSDFIHRFIAFLIDHMGKMDQEAFTAAVRQNLAANIKSANRSATSAALQEIGQTGNARADQKPEHQTDHAVHAEDMAEELIVQNAGLVIAAPYLPKLWTMFNLTTDEDKFKGLHEAERAVHLLQFMTDEKRESGEYRLVLNKILCGIHLSRPITRRIKITTNEREAIEGLVRGMIENWKTIGHTSVEGFRESFLQRRGRLTFKDNAWHLKVEQRAFDMLLDSIPWGFATIKHPWMEKVVYVKWR